MKITRLKLINFIGIKNGLGLDEIEINFPNNRNIITLLSGKNGSGKSTIMSMLSPFKDSFDDRKTLILPNKEGVKEIDYSHEGHVYKIKHIYGSKAASFISEDGVELNENGGVRTFEEIIKLKFKLTKDYFKIGKIGSNTENFIQFTTTQRKTYISTFVEAVQKYIDAFKIVADKAKLNEQQIKQISADLKKLDTVENIINKISEDELKLSTLENNISIYTGDIAKLEFDIDQISQILNNINYLETKSLLHNKENLLKKNNIINEKFNSQYKDVIKDNCDSMIQEINTKLSELNDKKTEDSKLLYSATVKQNTIINSIAKTDAQIKSIGTTNLDQSLKEINLLKDEIKDLKNKLQNNNFITCTSQYDTGTILTQLDSFKNFMTTMLSDYNTLNSCDIDKNIRNVELFFQPDFSGVFSRYAQALRESITNNQEAISSKSNEYSRKSGNLDKLDILDKRPAECSIDSCPFICDALQYKNLQEELNDLEKVINDLKLTQQCNEEYADKLSDIRVAYSEIAKAYKNMNARDNVIFRYFVKKYNKITEFTKLPLITLQNNVNSTVQFIETTIMDFDSLTSKQNKLEILESQYSSAQKIEANRIYFEKELIELQKQQNECNSEINSLKNKINSNTIEITNMTNKLKDFNDYKESITETGELEKEVLDLQNTINLYETNAKLKTTKTNYKTDLSTRLIQANKEKADLNKNITFLKATEINIKNLQNNMIELQKTFTTVDTVKNALNPKSGIPLIFIQSYLDGTEIIANELLNIAYNGKFEIKFVPTATDFFIQVRSGDNVIEDIKLASQGEISMTTISISLALIERALGDYNILYLDEIDGPLDKNNRESFINILNKQISKLNLEQIFVISHNNAFETCAMNLILLPGASIDKNNLEYMQNKDIIFDAEA